jgi:lipopolysaccharide transport system ATP-binding protein
MPDCVIQIEGLWKRYRYGAVSHRYLFKDLQSWWARVREKEDPNAKITMETPDTKRGNGARDDQFWALEDINLAIERGTVVGIIGRNGAGKSTLLKILSRVTAPTRGIVRIKGRIGSLLEVGTGFHPELTGRENIYLNGAILGMRTSEIQRQFDEIVDFAEIEKFIDTPVKRYSSGMYVRLAFAVAAHLDPEILVVDEVLAVGDAQFQKKCLGKMEDISKKSRRTIFFVSHHMPSIQRLCTRALLLKNGMVTGDGEVNAVIGKYLQEGADSAMHWYGRGATSEAFLREVIIADPAGREMEYLTTSSAFTIILNFSIIRKINDLQVSIAIQDRNGEVLFASGPNDHGIDPSGEPGSYSASITLPSEILLARTYGIRAALWTGEAGVFDAMENLWFSVQETDSFFNNIPRGRAGSLGIKCNWSIRQVASP